MNLHDMLPLNATVQYGYDISKYCVSVTDACIKCGLCVDACPVGVFEYPYGLNRLPQPNSYKCVYPNCEDDRQQTTDGRRQTADRRPPCAQVCPVDAIEITSNPSYQVLGDKRWTADLLNATWYEAKHARVPDPRVFEYRIGDSGGGFDAMRFIFEKDGSSSSSVVGRPSSIDLSLPLNHRAHGESITLPFPWYGGGMSFGSVGIATMLARAMAAKELGTFTSTGEGGFPRALEPYSDHMITQIATGLFGVREETLQWARILEFKYAQGAKPGLGGHLLADKVTPTVADLREAVPWRSLFSPFPFHSVYSVEDHKKHVDWARAVNPRALILVKVSTPEDVDMVAVGSYYAGAHIIHIDGGYGGTGAAPDIAKKNIAMPIEYAIRRAHQFLAKEGIRDEVTLMASGGIRTPYDVAKAIALGADGCVIGTAELIALHCVRCGNCESGRGCPWGIATTDGTLSQLIEAQRGAQQIVNMYHAWQNELRVILVRLGMKSVRELRGRTDVLEYLTADRRPRTVE
jgi:glutamate synthase domain-containing protein 2/NAD-dependent dihydropyrimidine dehydrogenase PreA subunit